MSFTADDDRQTVIEVDAQNIDVPNTPNNMNDDRVRELLVDKNRMASKMDKEMNILVDLLNSNNAMMMNSEVSNLDRLLAEYMYLNESYEPLVDAQTRAHSREAANQLDDQVFSLKQRVSVWFKNQDCSSSSSKSKSSSSSSSSKSKGSSRRSLSVRSNTSRNSQASQRSLVNRAALEALKAELNTLEDNRTKILDERMRKEQQDLEETMNELRKKIDITEAKQRVYDQPDFDKLKNSKNITVRKNHVVKPDISDSGHLKEEQENAVSPSLSHSMMQMMNAYSAPVTKIDVFTGNPLDYEYFKATFVDLVESKIPDQKGRLIRLLEYTTGEPKEIVREFIHDDPSNCYINAMEALEREYGNSQKLTAAYLRELKMWPPVKNNDPKGFRKIVRFLLK